MGLEGRSTVSLFLGMRACRYRTGASKELPCLLPHASGPSGRAHNGGPERAGTDCTFLASYPVQFQKMVFERDISFIA